MVVADLPFSGGRAGQRALHLLTGVRTRVVAAGALLGAAQVGEALVVHLAEQFVY